MEIWLYNILGKIKNCVNYIYIRQYNLIECVDSKIGRVSRIMVAWSDKL